MKIITITIKIPSKFRRFSPLFLLTLIILVIITTIITKWISNFRAKICFKVKILITVFLATKINRVRLWKAWTLFSLLILTMCSHLATCLFKRVKIKSKILICKKIIATVIITIIKVNLSFNNSLPHLNFNKNFKSKLAENPV